MRKCLYNFRVELDEMLRYRKLIYHNKLHKSYMADRLRAEFGKVLAEAESGGKALMPASDAGGAQ